jgi:hypothetical protein
VFTSSRKLFFSLFVALVCVLGMLSYAQNPPQSPVTADDFNQFTWRWVGPMTFSGRITGFAVPRGQSQTYYVLTASGGLWKTVDSGIHFEPIFEKYQTGSMGWMAIAPSKPDVLYLGASHFGSDRHGVLVAPLEPVEDARDHVVEVADGPVVVGQVDHG